MFVIFTVLALEPTYGNMLCIAGIQKRLVEKNVLISVLVWSGCILNNIRSF